MFSLSASSVGGRLLKLTELAVNLTQSIVFLPQKKPEYVRRSAYLLLCTLLNNKKS